MEDRHRAAGSSRARIGSIEKEKGRLKLKKPIFREMCLEKILKKTRKNSEKKISSYL